MARNWSGKSFNRTKGQQRFAKVAGPNIQRSVIDRSHSVRSSIGKPGLLYPFFVEEAIPGDTFTVRQALFIRFMTLLRPIMDNVYVDTHYFAVPYRLVWDNFNAFMGEQKNPGDQTDFTIPQMVSPSGGYDFESMEDAMGLPPLVEGYTHSALFHRACNLIWNEWFRDQNLQNALPVPTDDGPDDPADYKIEALIRNKRKDYFTSSLPWPQKGDPVTIGLGQQAPLVFPNPSTMIEAAGEFRMGDGSQTGVLQATTAATNNAKNVDIDPGANQISGDLAYASGLQTATGGAYADLSTATAATINELREAFQVQRVLERDARGGTRYAEIIASHFGLPIGDIDARLQRPEYLGGSSQPLGVTQVPNTSGVGTQGDLAAYGETLSMNGGFKKTCTEHMLLIGFVSIRADLTYQQGLDKMWSRLTRFDHYLPTLAHLGEQPIKNKELYVQGTSADEDTFGYQERWAEMRFRQSRLGGSLRSNHPQSLDVWHLSQDFANLPVLDSDFIKENPPIERVVAVGGTNPYFLMEAGFKVTAARPMPVYSTPGLIDHF